MAQQRRPVLKNCLLPCAFSGLRSGSFELRSSTTITTPPPLHPSSLKDLKRPWLKPPNSPWRISVQQGLGRRVARTVSLHLSCPGLEELKIPSLFWQIVSMHQRTIYELLFFFYLSFLNSLQEKQVANDGAKEKFSLRNGIIT